MAPMAPLNSLLLLLLLLLPLPLPASATRPIFFTSVASPNPFTAKASLLRYWSRKLPSTAHRPDFLFSKLSPLSAIDYATYSSLAASGPDALTPHLPAFCSAANLLCTPSLLSTTDSHPSNSNFTSYQNINFTNYGTDRPGGTDTFNKYSDDLNVPLDTFRRYSRGSAGHDDSFSSYSSNGNVVTTNFTSYATSATGGSGDFSSYHRSSNMPNLKFSNYEADANGRQQSFTSYSEDTNSGDQSFSGYGKRGNGIPTSFKSYSNNSNVINSGFSAYGEDGNGASNTFTSYGKSGNVPENTFRSYGEDGNGGIDTFISYRNQSNIGDDSFQSYAKAGTGARTDFSTYGASLNSGNDTFKGYGEGANDPNITFKSYTTDFSNFKSYSKSGVTFKDYKKAAAANVPPHLAASLVVESGKFFRESKLKEGSVMHMPDIRDKMPARSFLPRAIAGKIPFDAGDVMRVFGIPADTGMAKAVANTVAECGRPPSKGETKRCASSAEDVIDFAAAVLGGGAVVRSTATAVGSKRDVVIGKVRVVDGGKVTRAVSCHQSLFPYMVYYCHSVPEVRVYEAEILSVETREVINGGVAICHLDTSDWSAGHGAFVALGSVPGKIEVCHWIFQGDMTWTVDG